MIAVALCKADTLLVDVSLRVVADGLYVGVLACSLRLRNTSGPNLVATTAANANNI